MQREYLIIPEFDHREESAALADAYGAAFEYNDFAQPAIYQDAEEMKRRIEAYKVLPRDRSRDTLHGAFIDVIWSSPDRVIRERGRQLIEQSLDVAKELGVRGVVFHTGLIGFLSIPSYVDPWLEESDRYWHGLLPHYEGIDIFLENTFERSPRMLTALQKRMADMPQFQLCLDYGHAVLSGYPVEQWIAEMQPHIRHIHLNDNDLQDDLHMVPGDGRIDFSLCKQQLQQLAGVPVLLELNGLDRQKRALDYMTSL